MAKSDGKENAVSEIIDDAIVNEQGKDIITLDLAKTDFSKAIQDKIVEEFDNVLNIYDFDNMVRVCSVIGM